MNCRNSQNEYRSLIATPQSTTWTFIPLSPPVASSSMTGSRCQLEVVFTSPSVQLRTNRRLSDDGITWLAAAGADAGPTTTAVGWTYEETYLDASTSKAFVQFGVEVRNSSGSNKETGQVRLIVDTQTA